MKANIFTKKVIFYKLIKIIGVFCWLPLLFSLSGCSASREPTLYTATGYLYASTPIQATVPAVAVANPYSDLKVPTYITKIRDDYFIVDCYHNQVIYHDNLSDPLESWQVMTADINMGHTIAGDGTVYLIDDTENNRILVMERHVTESGGAVFVPTQEFADIGNRPHYIVYDELSDTFYAWSSLSGEMYLFRHEPDNPAVYLTEIRSIDSLMGIYVRSFTIIGNDIYFVSGNSTIIQADLDSFMIEKEYPVPDQLAGMIQITLIDDYYYITISTDVNGSQDAATIIRTKNLDSLAKGEYEDIYSYFVGGGTPYYITGFDNKWFLTEHRLPGHSIWSFEVEDNRLTNVISLY